MLAPRRRLQERDTRLRPRAGPRQQHAAQPCRRRRGVGLLRLGQQLQLSLEPQPLVRLDPEALQQQPRIGRQRRRPARQALAQQQRALLGEHLDDLTSSLDAFVTGGDRQDLLRRDGFRTSLVIRDGTGETMLAWRDQGESSLPVTTRWTLLHRSLSRPDNRTAREARVRELGFGMLETIPFTRLRVRAEAWTSDRALGSGLDYRRVHVTVGGDVSLGRHWGFVPQLDYGRLYGTPVPQAGFALGGTHSLRTIPSYTQLATGRAIARGELVLADDLRERLHLPLPAWLPLQVSTFAASAAVWGLDATGHEPARTRRDAPRAEDWRSEVGVALLWRPGIPEPSNFVRLDVARPIGPRDHRSTSVTFTVQRLIDLLPAPR